MPIENRTFVAVGKGFPDVAIDAAGTSFLKQASPIGAVNRAQLDRYIGIMLKGRLRLSTMRPGLRVPAVAGIYAVATIPEAQNVNGIGRIMTVMPLLDARQMGYRVGVLEASSIGYPNTQQLASERCVSTSSICSPTKNGDDTPNTACRRQAAPPRDAQVMRTLRAAQRCSAPTRLFQNSTQGVST